MRQLILLLMLLYQAWHLNAQNTMPILDRRVTIKITNQPLGKVLNIISETANFNFSYGNHIKVNKNVTIHAENRTVKEVLDQLFNNEISYQQIGNHLILQKKIVQKINANIQEGTKKPTKYNYVVSGYIRDLYSGNGITQVSVYEKQTLTSALSGDFGYYQMAVTSKDDNISLHYSIAGYIDTTVKLSYANNGSGEVHINLKSNKPPMDDAPMETDTLKPSNINDSARNKKDSSRSKLVWYNRKDKTLMVGETQLGKWFINEYQRLSEKNISDSFYRSWQFTFITPVGTNGRLSGLVTNGFSINTLIGYNGGVDGAEFGGCVNIVKREMKGAQFAGMANVVGRNVDGAQFAGFLNHSLGDLHGFQGAGFYNMNHGYAHGMQAAGFLNVNLKTMEGVQAAGFVNINASDMNGAQLAGFVNFNGHDLQGIQAAGFVNANIGSINGAQVAGFVNINVRNIDGIQAAGFVNANLGTVNGMQMAGFVNIAKKVNGGQMAGFVNIAKNVKGFQMGVINIADSVEGATLGIINFVRTGLHQIEISKNESNYGIAYRSGTRRLYSVLLVNSNLPVRDTNTLMSYGWGLGTSFKLTKALRLTLDATTQHLTYNFISDHLTLQSRLNANIEFKLFKGFALFGGASLNHLIADPKDSHFNSTFANYGTGSIYHSSGTYDRHAWIGYQFGIRLL